MANLKYDRRGFLRQAAVGTAVGTALWTERGEAKTRLDADVIVIGAGMAGISAAAALRRHRRVIVLEGRPDRIGGRIWTSFKWHDEPVDLGASWLSHEQVNPLKILATRAGIRQIPSDLTNFAVYEANGQRLSDPEIEKVEGLFLELVAEAKLIGLQRSLQRLPDIPASQAFASVLAGKSLPADTLRRLRFFADLFFQEAQAAPLSALSLFELGEDAVSFQGVQTASIIPDGYVQLVNLLSVGLDIRLGHVVDTIAYGKNGVAVTLTDGRTLRAKHAIVTLPLGVLKSGSVTFVPALPAWKQRSINRLGVGSTMKIYFRFPRTFWPLDKDGLHRIAETPEGRWTSWFNFHKYTGGMDGEPGKPTLLSFNHAPFGNELEKLSDAELMDRAWSVLKKQYKDRALRPIALQRSDWFSDPFSRGVIPNTPPGASSKDFVTMGHPVAGRLFFAGDSTTEDFPGFVLGAYQTGMREAQRILHLH